MRRKVYRTQIIITVCSPDQPLAAESVPNFEAIRHVIAEMEDGEFVGEAAVGPSVEVKSRAALRRQLIKIGNDGAFFDDLD